MPAPSDLVKKFKTLKNYVTNMHVELLLFNQIQITAWTEILTIVNAEDILTNPKHQLVAMQNKLTQNFADRKNDDDTQINQVHQAFNTKFKKLRELVQACIDEYNPRFSFSNLFTRDRKIDVLLARLQDLSEDSQL
jgi:exonuclease VII large subunit